MEQALTEGQMVDEDDDDESDVGGDLLEEMK